MSEAIAPAERAAVAEAFGVPVTDMFVSTEGLVGHSEPGGTVLTFASDTCLAECADDRVLVTNLHNLTQPLIRYELTDRFTPAGTSPGGALRASVEGRADPPGATPGPAAAANAAVPWGSRPPWPPSSRCP